MKELLKKFEENLRLEEKSEITISKYLRDVSMFYEFIRENFNGVRINDENILNKQMVIEYKKYLLESGYSVRSVNSYIASLNSYFEFLDKSQLKIKALKLQPQVYASKDRELTKEEYIRLCNAAEKNGNVRLSLILQTICGTGIRVSELSAITVEAVKQGEVNVSCKGKNRWVFIIKELKRKLLKYIRINKIQSGCVFVTSKGKPVNRSNIWREMKNLCEEANVSKTKVFPHNLRHLFARTFYSIEKDIAKLADILGHSSINTTRIYVITTSDEHIRRRERMHLII